ncbi:MAG: Rpp14/Pop5 family protein, partial [Staphylothermus sp.]|nr:Rpp14/Pop5 family protein [Staphylothermus sp.]
IITLLYLITKIRELKVKIASLRKETTQLKKILIQKVEEKIEKKKLRKRYLVFAILSEQKIDKKSIEETIRTHWIRFFGEKSLIKADPQLVYYEPSIKRGVIRVAHLYKDELIALMSTIKKIGNANCLLIPIKTAGTIKKARKLLYSLRRDLQK